MEAVTLQPAAGAQGELTGILMIRAYHRSRGDLERTEVLVPDSSHGTNPATASMAGFRTITIPSAPDGGVDLDGVPGGARPEDRGDHDHQPVHARPVRAPDRGAARGDPRRGRARLHGRREPQRHPRPVPAGRGRVRRDALQHPQDVQHAARRRRAGSRAGGRPAAPRSVPARPARAPRRPTARTASSARASGRPRSGVSARSSAAPASSSAPTPTSGRTAARGCARSPTTRCWRRTTSRHGCRRGLPGPVRPAVQARVRGIRPRTSSTARACAPSTSPSG